MEGEKRFITLCRIALALYALLMAYLMFLHRVPYTQRDYNLTPFRTILEFSRMISSSQNFLLPFSVANLSGNVLMFVPMGLLLPVLWRAQRRYWVFILTSAVIICLLELTQYLTYLGTADIDDLILNLLGASLGFAAYSAVRHLRRRCDRKKTEA